MIYICFRRCADHKDSQHIAGIGARNILFSLFGIETDPFKTESGKPRIGNEKYHFSISHSGCLAVCALRCKEEKYDLPEDVFTIFEDGEGEVGVDIQRIPKSEELQKMNRIAARFICTEFHSVEDFARSWTRKEAYAKYHDIPLTNAFKAEEENNSFFSGEVEIDDIRYAISVCY